MGKVSNKVRVAAKDRVGVKDRVAAKDRVGVKGTAVAMVTAISKGMSRRSNRGESKDRPSTLPRDRSNRRQPVASRLQRSTPPPITFPRRRPRCR